MSAADAAAGFEMIIAALLFLIGLVIIGFAAIVFMRAAADAARARSHAAEADAQERIVIEADRALEVAEPRRVRPTASPSEIREQLLAERNIVPPNGEREEEFSTAANAGEDERSGLDGSTYYRRPDADEHAPTMMDVDSV